MNTALLRRVAHHIDTHPERFCAAEWAWSTNVQAVVQHDEAPDHFRCCIAGHVLVEGGVLTEQELLRQSVRYDDGHLARLAAVTAKLTDDQRNELFYPALWADPLRSRYYLSAERTEEAAICAAYVRFFVDKHAPLAAPDRSAVEHQTPFPSEARPTTA